MTTARIALFTLLTLTTLTTVSALGALPPSTCSDIQQRETLLNAFVAQTKGGAKDQREAVKTAKAFLKYFGNCPDAYAQNQSGFIRNWLAQADGTNDKAALVQAVNTNPAQAFELARPLLASKPDDLHLQLLVLIAGIKSVQAGDRSHDAEALAAARRALELIEQGKSSESWAPFTNAQDAPDGLRYYIAFFSAEKSPDDAISNLTQVARSKSSFSSDATTYQLLGAAYYKGEVARLAAEYKEKYAGKEETAESKALLEKINGTLDKVIDCYARAVALSDGKQAQANVNASARKVLATVYAQRHDGSTDGMDEVVSRALTTPMP
jgi:hypothetical protein